MYAIELSLAFLAFWLAGIMFGLALQVFQMNTPEHEEKARRAQKARQARQARQEAGQALDTLIGKGK